MVVCSIDNEQPRTALLTPKQESLMRSPNMEVLTPRDSKEEFARRGDEIYDRDIRPCVIHTSAARISSSLH